ncbi:hypothetical protein V6N13_128937 [Hibiscus sabdariffa]
MNLYEEFDVKILAFMYGTVDGKEGSRDRASDIVELSDGERKFPSEFHFRPSESMTSWLDVPQETIALWLFCETYTLSKVNNLILNVDGAVRSLFSDLLAGSGMFTKQ